MISIYYYTVLTAFQLQNGNVRRMGLGPLPEDPKRSAQVRPAPRHMDGRGPVIGEDDSEEGG